MAARGSGPSRCFSARIRPARDLRAARALPRQRVVGAKVRAPGRARRGGGGGRGRRRRRQGKGEGSSSSWCWRGGSDASRWRRRCRRSSGRWRSTSRAPSLGRRRRRRRSTASSPRRRRRTSRRLTRGGILLILLEPRRDFGRPDESPETRGPATARAEPSHKILRRWVRPFVFSHSSLRSSSSPLALSLVPPFRGSFFVPPSLPLLLLLLFAFALVPGCGVRASIEGGGDVPRGGPVHAGRLFERRPRARRLFDRALHLGVLRQGPLELGDVDLLRRSAAAVRGGGGGGGGGGDVLRGGGAASGGGGAASAFALGFSPSLGVLVSTVDSERASS